MKNPLTLSLVMLLGCIGCSSSPYFGTSSSPAPRSAPTVAPVVRSASIVLSVEQIAAVRSYYSSPGDSNGRGRNGGLPPGIARNLARGKALPPGIAKQHLPQNLRASLPVLDAGLDYVVAAGKLLLIDAATQVVREILIDAIYG